MRVIGTASVMRHGATRYTGIFPDLAEEGLPRLKAAAREITQRFPKRPVFLSSPADRAIATTLYIMDEYNLILKLKDKREDILVDGILGPILVFNQKPFVARLARISGHIKDALEIHRKWDRLYMKSRFFENGLFCESRSSARNRFGEFLKSLPVFCGTDRHLVAVTHLELVGTVAVEWFGVKGDYFAPAEMIHLTILNDGWIEAEFRGERKILRL